MTTTELIAEFMGLDASDDMVIYNSRSGRWTKSQYSKSRSWIIPVVQKLYDMKKEFDLYPDVGVVKRFFALDLDKETTGYIFLRTCALIKWYNHRNDP